MTRKTAKPTDLNQRAAAIVSQATSDRATDEAKNPHAVELGKLGGEARAAQFKTARERREAARHAANARWAKHRATQAKEA